MTTDVNDNLILISGKSATGKSLSLMNLKDPEGVIYLNCEVGKKLPFKSKFIEKTVVDPFQVYDAFNKAETMPEVHTIVVDSLTFLMDMFESVHVLPATNTIQAWGQYAQFLKNMMSQYVAQSTKNVIFTAHTLDILNEQTMEMETRVKVKGSVMNTGVESYFSSVISTKRMSLAKLEPYHSDYLNISERDKRLEVKYCFQTDITADTRQDQIRSPLDMWAIEETYIDNDVQNVIERLHQYY